MFKQIFLGVFLMLVVKLGFSQVGVLVLDQPEIGIQDHLAPIEVRLLPGYSYVPAGTDYMRSWVSSYDNGYAPQWENFENLVLTNDVFSKNSGTNMWNGNVKSRNVLEGDGWMKQQVQIGGGSKIWGFANDKIVYNDFYDMLFGFYRLGNSLRSMESGVQTNLGSCDINDLLVLERIGDKVYYIKNGNILRQINVDGSLRLIAGISTSTQGTQLANLVVSFDVDALTADITSTPLLSNIGPSAVDLTVKGGQSPYTYSWSPEDQITQNISNVGSGDHTVTITDASGTSIERTANIGYAIQWENIENLTLTDDMFIKTSGTNMLNGNASSQNVLVGDGWMRQHIKINSSASSQRMWGFADDAKIYNDQRDILYGFAFSGFALRVIENGVQTNLGSYGLNDELILEREGDILYYKRNRRIIKEVTIDRNLRLIAGLSINVQGQQMSSPVVSFDVGALTADITSTPLLSNIGPSAANLTVKGGQSPYTYSWLPEGQTTQNISNVGFGDHTVTITDASGTSIERTANIGYAILWENLVNLTLTDDILTKSSGSNGWNGNSNSENVLVGDGWMRQHIKINSSASSQRRWGFADASKPYVDYRDILYGFSFSGFALRAIENGVQTHLDAYGLNDELLIELIGNKVYYKRNGRTLREITVDPNLRLIAGFSINVQGQQMSSPVVSFGVDRAFDPSIVFAHLSKKLDGGVYKVMNDKLYLKYREEYNTADFKFNLYDDASNVIATESNIAVNTFLGYGDNRIEIPLTGAGVNLNSGYYTLEVINVKKEKWYLRIEY